MTPASRFFCALVTLVLVGGCSSSSCRHYASRSHKVSSATLRPYKIRGVWYYPVKGFRYDKTGWASWYGEECHNKKTATGDRFDMHYPTAAHKELDIPCVCEVTNLENGRTLKLVFNDRGPFHNPRKRIADLSREAAVVLGFHKKGLARVHIRCLPSESRRLRKTGRWP